MEKMIQPWADIHLVSHPGRVQDFDPENNYRSFILKEISSVFTSVCYVSQVWHMVHVARCRSKVRGGQHQGQGSHRNQAFSMTTEILREGNM